jgi:hypothetical protein
MTPLEDRASSVCAYYFTAAARCLVTIALPDRHG